MRACRTPAEGTGLSGRHARAVFSPVPEAREQTHILHLNRSLAELLVVEAVAVETQAAGVVEHEAAGDLGAGAAQVVVYTKRRARGRRADAKAPPARPPLWPEAVHALVVTLDTHPDII